MESWANLEHPLSNPCDYVLDFAFIRHVPGREYKSQTDRLSKLVVMHDWLSNDILCGRSLVNTGSHRLVEWNVVDKR